MKRPVNLVVELDFPNAKVAGSIFEALMVEMKSGSRRKADADAHRKGRYITLRFATSTSASMRAIVNSYLRWVYSISETLDKLGKK